MKLPDNDQKMQYSVPDLTPRSAADGSPRKSAPTLSISSSIKTGFFVPAVLIPCMILPEELRHMSAYVRGFPLHPVCLQATL